MTQIELNYYYAMINSSMELKQANELKQVELKLKALELKLKYPNETDQIDSIIENI